MRNYVYISTFKLVHYNIPSLGHRMEFLAVFTWIQITVFVLVVP
jgi:hypothetical protein